MRFEHIIEVNDRQGVVSLPLTRAQLWAGVWQRVLYPQRFPLGPDACRLEPGATPARLRRQVSFGALQVRDEVEWIPGERIVFVPEAAADLLAVVLTITLENHPPTDEEALYLRFVYEVSADDPETDSVRQQAWLANDRDMMRTIRRWAESGALDSEVPDHAQ